MMRKLRGLGLLAGVDLAKLGASLLGLPRFVGDWHRYRRSSGALGGRFEAKIQHLRPMLTDWSESAGLLTEHYFHQDLWAARLIYQRRPEQHVDIGSRIDGFVAHLLSFMPVTVVDIRPMRVSINGLSFIQSDATDLREIPEAALDSLSSLHAVEHFGLGRYGDSVDPMACYKAMNAMSRVLKPGGRLYFSVPVGRERVCFNAHRVFAPRHVVDVFESAGLKLVSFSAVDDANMFVPECAPEDLAAARLSCGLYEWTK